MLNSILNFILMYDFEFLIIAVATIVFAFALLVALVIKSIQAEIEAYLKQRRYKKMLVLEGKLDFFASRRIQSKPYSKAYFFFDKQCELGILTLLPYWREFNPEKYRYATQAQHTRLPKF